MAHRDHGSLHRWRASLVPGLERHGILEGDLPTAPTVALQAARTLRRFLKDNTFSPEARAVLEQRLSTLEERAVDPGLRAVEDKEAQGATAQA